MISKIRKWLYWHDWVYFIAGMVATAIGLIFIIVYLSGEELKYNCNLEKRPGVYTSMFINSDPYAYDPDGFCAMLKQKMETGDVKN